MFGPKVLITILQSLALLSSIVRLVHRVFIRKLWWDDMWAAVAFFTDAALFVAFLFLMVSINFETSECSPPYCLPLRRRWLNLSMPYESYLLSTDTKDVIALSRWVTLLGYTIALW